jgi:glycosyltransferase involved in cell wall biosynthesis
MNALTVGEPVHAFILTLDEEQHIARCIASIKPYCASVLVIDSASTDRTREIAAEMGAEVIVHPFTTHAAQVNAAIQHIEERGGWLMRIDADEVLEPPRDGILVPCDEPFDGLIVRRHIHFLGRRMLHGGLQPNWHLRLWRAGKGRCEPRWMDEHIVVDGRTRTTRLEIADINLNPVGWWTAKHNNYASREAIEVLDRKYALLERPAEPEAAALHGPVRLKRLVKERLFNRLPGGMRAKVYFFWRYWVRLGFLDGSEGYFFHFLQVYWYRTLIDCKVREIELYRDTHRVPLKEAVAAVTGLKV